MYAAINRFLKSLLKHKKIFNNIFSLKQNQNEGVLSIDHNTTNNEIQNTALSMNYFNHTVVYVICLCRLLHHYGLCQKEKLGKHIIIFSPDDFTVDLFHCVHFAD